MGKGWQRVKSGGVEQTRFLVEENDRSLALIVIFVLLLYTFRVVVVVLEDRVLGVDLLVRVLKAVVCVWAVSEREERKKTREVRERKKMSSGPKNEPSIAKEEQRCLLFQLARFFSQTLSRQTQPSMSSSDMVSDALVGSKRKKGCLGEREKSVFVSASRVNTRVEEEEEVRK